MQQNIHVALLGKFLPHLSISGNPVVECSPGVLDVKGSIPGQVIPKTLKMLLGASLLSTKH